MQPLRDRLGRPLDEKLVDPLGLLERGAQPVARLGVEQQGGAAAIEIGVEQHGVPPRRDAEMPGEVGRDGGRADAAAHARDRHHAPAQHALGLVLPGRDEGVEMPRHHIARERLVEIFERAQPARHVAIEIDVLEIADHQHLRIRLDHLGEIAERGQRLLLPAYIDDERARGWRAREHADRRAHIAAPDLHSLRHRLGERLAQHRLR